MEPNQYPIQWVPSLFLGVKRSECESESEVEHLSLCNAEVKLVDLYLYSPTRLRDVDRGNVPQPCSGKQISKITFRLPVPVAARSKA